MSSDNGRRKSKLLCVEAVCKTVENSFGTIYNLKNCCTCEDLLQHCPEGRVYEPCFDVCSDCKMTVTNSSSCTKLFTCFSSMQGKALAALKPWSQVRILVWYGNHNSFINITIYFKCFNVNQKPLLLSLLFGLLKGWSERSEKCD